MKSLSSNVNKSQFAQQHILQEGPGRRTVDRNVYDVTLRLHQYYEQNFLPAPGRRDLSG